MGVVAYVTAVLGRTSFGVAGHDAAHRFGAGASVLSLFVVLQLLVYAGMQVPVGMLLDRYGSRRLVVTGAALMALGQLVLAFTTSLPLAIGGRLLAGAGDALTFISVLRLVAAWFPARRVPVVTQLTGLLGQLGQVLSAVPLALLLHGAGWTPAFTSVAALSLLAGVLCLALMRDTPEGRPARSSSPSASRTIAQLREAWRHPGTRLGLWTHFGTQFSGTVFALLWGVPFLVGGEGFSRAQASAMLVLFALASVAAGPVIGELTARHPLRRSWLVLAIVAAAVATWSAVLTLPGRAPVWLVVLLVLAIAIGGPGSMIGFDYARTFNPHHRLGTASGIVNVGGFTASLLVVFAIGVALQVVEPAADGAWSLGAFRVALAVQYPVWAIAVVGILRSRAAARRQMARDGVTVPPLREVLARYRG